MEMTLFEYLRLAGSFIGAIVVVTFGFGLSVCILGLIATLWISFIDWVNGK